MKPTSIIRVFPSKTKATPIDSDVRIGTQPGFCDEADEVHVSVAFSWDLPLAERLAEMWKHVAPVKMGGPATGQRSEEFVPGRYIRHGYVITSRGCPNRCWFCSVWRREGHEVRTLPICDGWNVLDDNLLACPEEHIRAVFAMLKRQKRRAEFTGGLEPKRVKDWHVDLLVDLKPEQIFMAYDTRDDWEPLVEAAKKFVAAGFTRNTLRCYVLIGGPGDTIDAATKRLEETKALGICPMAMLWRDEQGKRLVNWARFQRSWARPAEIYRQTERREDSDQEVMFE